MRLFKYGGDLLSFNLHLNANCDKKKLNVYKSNLNNSQF